MLLTSHLLHEQQMPQRKLFRCEQQPGEQWVNEDNVMNSLWLNNHSPKHPKSFQEQGESTDNEWSIEGFKYLIRSEGQKVFKKVMRNSRLMTSNLTREAMWNVLSTREPDHKDNSTSYQEEDANNDLFETHTITLNIAIRKWRLVWNSFYQQISSPSTCLIRITLLVKPNRSVIALLTWFRDSYTVN